MQKLRFLSLAVSMAMASLIDTKKVTKDFLESEIDKVEYNRLGGTLTHCTIYTHDGFTFTGESACVDPEQFDEEIGKQIAYKMAFDKMYPHYGFLLNFIQRHKNQSEEEDDAEENQMLTFGDAIEQLKLGKTVARQGWNGKGMFLFVVKGATVTKAIEDCYGDPSKKGVHTALDAIYMHTVQGDLVPWLASQTDVLSVDWQVV